MTFAFRIAKAPNGATIIDTTKTTEMESLTPSQQIEYIETQNQLFALERERKRKEWVLNKKIKIQRQIASLLTVAISSCVSAWGLVTFDAWLFTGGLYLSMLATSIPSIVEIAMWMEKANESFENYMKIKFPKFWEFLNS